MKIIVTGGAGFIGSVVTELLCDQGHEVLVWDNLANGHRSAVDTRAQFQWIDLLDTPAIRAGMSTFRPAAVVHLAAEALIDVSMRDPGRFYRANLVGGIHLLDAMMEAGVKRLVFSSTAATYGQPDRTPITEDMAGRPCNSYGESKWAFERALAWYQTAHGLRHISLRYFNACGATTTHGEDHRPETHIIPLLFATALGQHPVFQLFGTDRATPDGTCIRDYVHVVDIARAHLCALEKMDVTEPAAVNLGLGHGYSNRQVIEMVKQVTDLPLRVEPAPRRPGDPDILIAASERARSVLGWIPQYPDLEVMVTSAWAWRKAHPEGYTS
ncbi:MAG: UDP-glucose 4-epimerase GalE [Verrucomicrobia bacterium]|nr:MAG: UDP-glucose 4-epimerase GalE [Verrucomicrobiota bacterium]